MTKENRVTIRGMDQELYKLARAEALKQGRNIGDCINEAVRGWLPRIPVEFSIDLTKMENFDSLTLVNDKSGEPTDAKFIRLEKMSPSSVELEVGALVADIRISSG